MRNYNGNNYYSYNSNLAYDERYYEKEVNNFDIKVERTRGLSKSRPKSVLLGFLAAAVLFFGIFYFLFQLVHCCTLEHNIELRKTEIKHLEDQIIDTDVKIAENLDAGYIKKIAIGKLGMVEASDAQTIYYSSANVDTTVNYNNTMTVSY